MKCIIFIALCFIVWRNGGSEKLNDGSKVTWLKISGKWDLNQVLWFQILSAFFILLDPHNSSESGKCNNVSVSQLNMGEAERSLVTGTRSLSQQVTLVRVYALQFSSRGFS